MQMLQEQTHNRTDSGGREDCRRQGSRGAKDVGRREWKVEGKGWDGRKMRKRVPS